MKKMNVKALGLALGITWGLGMLILGLGAAWFDLWSGWMAMMGEAYVGFDATIGGAIIGFVWGFIDGLIGGVVIAWLYNRLS